MTEPIIKFRGEYRFLSNFHPAPMIVDGFLYPTSENAYQGLKYSTSTSIQQQIADMAPGDAKRYAQDNPVEITDAERLNNMFRVLTLKFIGHKNLMKKLLATRDAELIEGNDWGDTFWGICDGQGKNHLGKLLMTVRDKAAIR